LVSGHKIPPIGRSPTLYCLAYRTKRSEGASEHEAWETAEAALQAVWPVPFNEALQIATNAIAYIRRYHSEWPWRGVTV